MSGTIECPVCAARVDVVALLSRLGGFYRDIEIGGVDCPACGKRVEFRASGNRLALGSTYWAGSLHFEAMTETEVAGIRIIGEGEDRAVELDGVTYRPRR